VAEQARTRPGEETSEVVERGPLTPAPTSLQEFSSALGNQAFGALLSRQPQPAAATGAAAEIVDFRKKAWPALPNYEPSSQRGRFDVKLDAAAGKVDVKLKIGFKFKDGDPKQYPGFRPDELKWTDDAEKEKFAKRYMDDAGREWSGAGSLRNTKPGWEGVTLTVAVSVVRDDASPHFHMDLIKAPPDAMPAGAGVAPPGTHQEERDGKLEAVDNAAGDRTGHAVMDTNTITRPLPHLDRHHNKKNARVQFKPGTAEMSSSSQFMAAFHEIQGKDAITAIVLTGSASTFRPSGVTKEDFPVWAMDLSRQRTRLIREGLTGFGLPDEKITVMNSGANQSSAAPKDDYVEVLIAVKPLQTTAVHETGHMLGNPDEYSTKAHPKGSAVDAPADKMYREHGSGAVVKRDLNEGVMSVGDKVGQQNYAAFAEAVSKITGMAEWRSG
jgi:hypothetical protein